ncbi:MAG TPA: 1-acyl-sn-glycerol-3-phosphate acyltransferase [Spirochaetota bacterium]|nr:1-acyl-sn-glycerol-3-phosphate acyltransferase [Spirochaetota bacterium]
MIRTVATYILYGFGAILLYEIIRALIAHWIKKRLYGSVRDYLSDNRIRIDRYKFMHKIVVKEDLLNNPEVHRAVIAHALENKVRIQDVQEKVEEYIEEIVPFFNLLAYYKVGDWVSRLILNFLYEVVIDSENAAKLSQIPRDSVVVVVMNHRSNVDYVLVAYMLAQQISLSYAVGEWARVWPLEHIFKSFGAYFIRRNYREKLYHRVLEKYVQLISLQGVTQGVFVEGGLSRDGLLRPAKIGILDYIIRIKNNPDFNKELVFVPAAINYDHVLEDSTLVAEWKKGKMKSGFRDNLKSLIKISFKIPYLGVVNTLRYVTGRIRRHGYASVSFGDPVFLSDFLKTQDVDIFSLERHERLARVQIFADGMLRRIGEMIPVTPMCITARALVSMEKGPVARSALVHRVEQLRREIKRRGGRIVTGKAFELSAAMHDRLESEKEERTRDLVSFEEDFLEGDESVQTVKLALDIMKKRKMVKVKKGTIQVNRGNRALLEYYSNSLTALLGEQ